MTRKILKYGIAITALFAVALPAFAHERGDRMERMHGQQGGRGGAMLIEQFDAIDADGNGQITVAEIEAHAKARFDAADTNGDGKLSAEEMTAQREKVRAERMASMQKRMIERADKDGDGEISFDEAQAMRPGNADKMFQRLDLDENGGVTKTELEAMSKRMADRGHGGRMGGHGPADKAGEGSKDN